MNLADQIFCECPNCGRQLIRGKGDCEHCKELNHKAYVEYLEAENERLREFEVTAQRLQDEWDEKEEGYIEEILTLRAELERA